MHATDVNPLFYSALLLSALPVPLLRQVPFFVFLRFFFRVCFLLVFWKVLEGSFGARIAHFESILRSFGSHFYDFLGIRWISENVCFSKVKQQLLRFGRVPNRVFFVFFFRSIIFRRFLNKFCGFVESQGPHGAPNGSHFGSLRGQVWV